MERAEVLKSNLTEVQHRIADSAKRSGRSADDVQLIAVTKYVDAETTRELINSGCDAIGESRPQLFKEKQEKLSDLKVDWHMIGHLQRNKIKFVLPHASLIHSVDSLRLIDAIDSAAEKTGQTAAIFLEVNISGESAKHGFQESELAEALERVQKSKWIHANGLMGMSRLGGNEDDAKREFGKLREVRDSYATRFASEQIQLKELSMGMTGDFDTAIAEGSTMVRIGSALFRGIL